MKKIARSAIVEHSAAEMYALVEDIEAYPSFLPWCSAAEVHARRGDVTEATLTVGVGALRHSFTTRNTSRPGEAIDLELVKGAYGNLILFASPDGPRKWRENPVHHRAVDISPANYHDIRLHQGRLAGRLLDGGALHVTRTRYLDYSGPEVWRAVRAIPKRADD